jgi:hypothetical protein
MSLRASGPRLIKQQPRQALNLLQRSFFFDHDDTDQQPMTAAQPFAVVRGWLLGQFLLPNDLDLCVLLAVLVFVGWGKCLFASAETKKSGKGEEELVGMGLYSQPNGTLARAPQSKSGEGLKHGEKVRC